MVGVEEFPLAGFGVHGEVLLDAAASGAAHEAAVCFGPVHELEHCGGEGWTIVGKNEVAGFASKFADAANVGSDEGLFHGHGFAES